MKCYNLFFIFSVLFTLLINVCQADDSDCESEGYYTVTAKYPYGKFDSNDSEFKDFLKGIMFNVDMVINVYKYTYENQDKVDELHEQFMSEYNKDDMNFENAGLVKVNSLNEEDGTIILSVYINSKIMEKVKKLNIITSIDCKEVKVDPVINNPVDIVSDGVIRCTSQIINYPCCPEGNTRVLFEDSDGAWGFDFENDYWCGLTPYVEPAEKKECFSLALGYPCCIQDNVEYEDENGIWGFENFEWCGIASKDDNSKCFSLELGYPCCSSTLSYVYEEDENGKWGYEDHQWCGIGK